MVCNDINPITKVGQQTIGYFWTCILTYSCFTEILNLLHLNHYIFLEVLKFNWIIIQQSSTINNLPPKHLLPDKIDIVYLHGYSWPLYDRTLVFKYAPHTVLLVALYTSQENSPALSAIAKVAKMFLDSMQIFPGSEDAGVTTFACVEETGRKLGMSEGRWQNLIKRAGLPDQEKKKKVDVKRKENSKLINHLD